MKELKKMIINGTAYAIADDSKIPVPSAARVGQTVVVSAVDETGRPTAWTAANAVTVAYFEAVDEDAELFYCTSHTAAELIGFVNDGTPVIAVLRSQGDNTAKCTMCFAEGDYRLVAGDFFADAGWQHRVGQRAYYADGDITNCTPGNELWSAY